MSSSRRKPLLLFVLLALALLAATALAAERVPAQPAAGFTPRYGVAAEMEVQNEISGSQVVDLATGRIYATADDSRLLSIIETQPALRETPYTPPFRLGQLALSPEGDRLYLLEEPPFNTLVGRIAIMDTVTRAIVDTSTFTCPDDGGGVCAPEEAAVGADGRLYVVLTGRENIDIHDGDTGDRLLRFPYPDGPLAGFAVHGATLYTTHETAAGNQSMLRRFDISDVTPVAGPSVTLPQNAYTQIQVAPNGSFLLVTQGNWQEGTMLQVAADSLATIRDYRAEGLHNSFKGTLISADSREIVFLWGYWNYSDGHIIEARDAATGALLRIGFAQATRDYDYLNGFVPLPNNRIATLFIDAIAVLHPFDYAATAPVVMAGFCGGPFIDTFSNPASGWPVADLGPVAYRYDNDQYSILQRESERWSAVSRGDVWNNWERAGVRTWVPAGDGISGLVFGLNADWTEFYTVEVIPSDHRWVVFAYHAGTGWELKATDQGAGGPNESTSLLLIQAEDGSLAILVNDRLVYGLPAVPAGRIGLSGGSFESQVDLRFDDYMIVTGPNCFPNNVRAAEIERSPAISRPPLEAFIK
jgi:hypothetical protein